jgi:hypothetical protein
MNHLNWLIGYRFQLLTQREHDWMFAFDRDTVLVAECLWRLIENGRIRLTSNDDGHRFGLPEPLDAAGEINSRLRNAEIEGVDLLDGTLDLSIHFATGHVIQLLPDSAGYEAWNISCINQQFIAVGGGELTIFGNEQNGVGTSPEESY